MTIDNIVTDDDLIAFCLDQYKQTGNHNFMAIANGIQLSQREVDFLRWQLKRYEWISVKDRLPEDFKTVLALCKDGGMFVGRHTSWHRWEIFTAMKSTRVVSRTVTHWMPLPASPTEKEG